VNRSNEAPKVSGSVPVDDGVKAWESGVEGDFGVEDDEVRANGSVTRIE
jgi:hypothetical protein